MPTDEDIDRLATLHFISLVDSLMCEAGHVTEELLQGVDLEAGDIHQGLGLISPAQEYAIVQNALNLTGDKHLGLALGRRCRLASLGIFGFTLLSSNNLREALALLFEYPLPLGSGYQLELIEEFGVVVLRVKDISEIEGELRLLAIEFCLTALHRLMSDLLCKALPLRSVNIAHGERGIIDRYRQYFDCPVFMVPGLANALSFDAHWLDLSLPWAHPVAHSEMKKQCAELKLNLEVPRSTLGNIRSAICAQFEQTPTLKNVARSMECSSKTVQRHLRAAGTSFGELLGELRYQRAQELLAQKMPVSRIAERLGFSEPAAFRRAFKRWSGCTPSQYRSRVRD